MSVNIAEVIDALSSSPWKPDNDLAARIRAEGITAVTEKPEQEFGIIDPDYARIFTQALIIAWQYGYACLAHGTFTRDLDLLFVPWADNVIADAQHLVNRLADASGLRVKGPFTDKPHGRKTWTLLFTTFGDPRWVDVSAFAFEAMPEVQS